MKMLNLACGHAYVSDQSWSNLDFRSSGKDVTGCDLLDVIPFDNEEFDLVYSSHFLEHIPIQLVPDFLQECKRVLKPGGVIRLVLPDAEEMFSSFLSLRGLGKNKEANFLMLEIIDQCVRNVPGGALGRFISEVETMDAISREQWHAFIGYRIGELANPSTNKTAEAHRKSYLYDLYNNFLLYISNPLLRYSQLIRYAVHQVGLIMLLPSFRRQNVSTASIGEKHCWLWDFYQLQAYLQDAGFHAITRVNHKSSAFRSFPFVPLDCTANGNPRQGIQSMYIEAQAPSCH